VTPAVQQQCLKQHQRVIYGGFGRQWVVAVALVVVLAMALAERWLQWIRQQSTKKWQQLWQKWWLWSVVAAACREMAAAVVAEAEANLGENRGNSGNIDGDGSGNVGISGGGCNGGQQQQQRPKQGQQWQGWQQ
jgi:hypothetical protein